MSTPVRSGDEAAPRPMTVLAFDPGRFVGFARVDPAGLALELDVVRDDALDAWLAALRWSPGTEVAVVGAGTGHAAFVARLPRGLPVHLVHEEGTTLEARELWRTLVPVRGLGRIVPRGLRHPTGRIDDFAAWAIARRFLGESKGEGVLQPPRLSSGLHPR